MVYIRVTTRRYALSSRRVERTAQLLLDAAGCADASLSLSFVGDAAMRRLNREHRGRDRTTDVLSFPLYPPFSAPKHSRMDGPEPLLGDIVISLNVAERQARAYGATLEKEVARLLVHGLAHLIGHDHEKLRDRARMQRFERKLSAAIGLAWPYEGTV